MELCSIPREGIIPLTLIWKSRNSVSCGCGQSPRTKPQDKQNAVLRQRPTGVSNASKACFKKAKLFMELRSIPRQRLSAFGFRQGNNSLDLKLRSQETQFLASAVLAVRRLQAPFNVYHHFIPKREILQRNLPVFSSTNLSTPLYPQ